MIKRNIRKNVNGRKVIVGLMVADKVNGLVKYGSSKAAITRGDSFDPDYGMCLAIQRLNARDTVPIPNSMAEDFIRFEGRCNKYFKDADGFMKILYAGIKA